MRKIWPSLLLLGALPSVCSAQVVAQSSFGASYIAKVGHWQLSKIGNTCFLEDHFTSGTHIYLSKSPGTDFVIMGLMNAAWQSIRPGAIYPLKAGIGEWKGATEGEGDRIAGLPTIKIKWREEAIFTHARSPFYVEKDGSSLINATFYHEEDAFRALTKCAAGSVDPFAQ